jgi:hypothetical protein
MLIIKWREFLPQLMRFVGIKKYTPILGLFFLIIIIITSI